MDTMKKERLAAVRARIYDACKKAGRSSESVRLLAVSKTKSWEEIRDFLLLGQIQFGENYVQEALGKMDSLRAWAEKNPAVPKPEWHLIGKLQSNKAKLVPGNFSLFHALDSLSLAQKLAAQATKMKRKVSALVEVNLHGEEKKAGVEAEALFEFLESANKLDYLEIRGLMCIPSPALQAQDPRRAFAQLRELLEKANKKGAYASTLTELSMGMSGDFEAAILEGATIVRVGTLLFGERS